MKKGEFTASELIKLLIAIIILLVIIGIIIYLKGIGKEKFIKAFELLKFRF